MSRKETLYTTPCLHPTPIPYCFTIACSPVFYYELLCCLSFFIMLTNVPVIVLASLIKDSYCSNVIS